MQDFRPAAPIRRLAVGAFPEKLVSAAAVISVVKSLVRTRSTSKWSSSTIGTLGALDAGRRWVLPVSFYLFNIDITVLLGTFNLTTNSNLPELEYNRLGILY